MSNLGCVLVAKELPKCCVRGSDYLYNGKENEEELGLNWQAYGFRYYDNAIGRFTGVDPISEQFAWVSTYNYAENSPIRFIDLHGLQIAQPEQPGSQGTHDPLTRESFSEDFVGPTPFPDLLPQPGVASPSPRTPHSTVENDFGLDENFDYKTELPNFIGFGAKRLLSIVGFMLDGPNGGSSADPLRGSYFVEIWRAPRRGMTDIEESIGYNEDTHPISTFFGSERSLAEDYARTAGGSPNDTYDGTVIRLMIFHEDYAKHIEPLKRLYDYRNGNPRYEYKISSDLYYILNDSRRDSFNDIWSIRP